MRTVTRLTPDDLSLVRDLLVRDMSRADTGETVDVRGILTDLRTLTVPDLTEIVCATVATSGVRKGTTKDGLLTRVENRLTAVTRSQDRNSV